jgi:hypothetical protein
MRLISLICLLLLVSVTSASVVINSFSAQGIGEVSRHIDTTFEYGSGSAFVGGASGSVILAAPGPFQYQTRDTTDARINNRYNQTGYARFDNGGVGSETVSMESSSPSQYVAIDHSYILQSAEIDTAKFVSDSNVSIGQRASWDGAGIYTRDLSYGVEISQSGNDPYNVHPESGIRYRSTQSDHAIVLTNSTGGAIVRPEFSFTGFEDAFVINSTPAANETAVNNTTVEGA